MKYLATLLMLFPAISFAYLDPGTGSAIMSAIIGFFVAIGLVIKTFWYKIKSVFTRIKDSDKKPEDQN